MKTALVLACDDNFVAYTSVIARWVAYSATEKFPIIIVSNGVSEENKLLARKFCPQLSFIEAGPFLQGTALPVRGRFTPAAYLRLFLDVILSDFDRVVYLDSDVTPLTDVSPMLGIIPKSGPLIAAYDLPVTIAGERPTRLRMQGAYFNSGVMILDLQALRTERIFSAALSFALDHSELCTGADQDPLNSVLDGRWQVLDWRWNMLNGVAPYCSQPSYLRHHTGPKPWSSEEGFCEDHLRQRWKSGLAESPWPEKYQAPKARALGAFRRRMTRPVIDALGLTPKRRHETNAFRAELTRITPIYLSMIDPLARDGSRSVVLRP